MTTGVPRGAFALAGFAAGALVGFVDGLWAGAFGGGGLTGTLTAAALAAAVNGLVALLASAGVEVAARLSLWGRAVRARGWAQGVAALVAGVGAAAATVAVILGALPRRNRFLAGGEAALVGVACAVLGAALAPALARVLGRHRGPGSRFLPTGASKALPPSAASLVVLAPIVAAAVGGIVMAGVAALRAGVSAKEVAPRAAVAAVEMALLPGLLLLTARIPLRLRRWQLAVATVLLLLLPATLFVTQTWADHLRFLPWEHVLPAAGMVALAALLTAVPRARSWFGTFGRRGAMALTAVMVVLLAASLTVSLTASESEQARKLTATRVAFVGPLLAVGRRALDRDHDGFSPWFGGGDCDDGDAGRYPGMLDVPDDGIDQDCDGSDASFAALTPGLFAPVPDSVPRGLNLLLITIDTVRADHLGCYGYARATSPEIDAVAAGGGLFVNGWAHAPSTRYSMPAIATGRWPSAITWDESIWWPRIGPAVPTLAQSLKAAGYFTAAFYSYDYFSLADHRGFERGVDQYRAERAVLHQAVNGPMESHGSSSRQMADDTIAFLESHDSGKFFLWVHFYDPHLSYEPHPEVPPFGDARVDRYDGEIRFTDLHLGRVFRRLRELGLWERTAVFITGDHGEGFGEHGVTEHGFDLYAAQTRVPFIVRVPGLAPRRITAPAGHVDLAPTMLNLARAPQNQSFLGRSLVADLTGAVGEDGTLPAGTAASRAPRAVFQEVSSERGKKRALVSADTHLIWNWTPENTTECYDRRSDPDERHDIWGGGADGPCRALKVELQGMVSALSVPPDVAQKVRSSVFPSSAAAPAPATVIDARIGDVLRVAGYTLLGRPVAGRGDAEVTIHFETLKPITGGWRFFFHLIGPAGFRNLDHVPVEGAMPAERWRPGQVILDHVRIPFPAGSPPGRYTLLLGLYRGGERLPVSPPAAADGNRAVRLMTLDVK